MLACTKIDELDLQGLDWERLEGCSLDCPGDWSHGGGDCKGGAGFPKAPDQCLAHFHRPSHLFVTHDSRLSCPPPELILYPDAHLWIKGLDDLASSLAGIWQMTVRAETNYLARAHRVAPSTSPHIGVRVAVLCRRLDRNLHLPSGPWTSGVVVAKRERELRNETTRVPTAPAQSSSFLERHKLPAEVAGLEGRLTISGQIGHLGELVNAGLPPIQSALRGWREVALLGLELTWSRTAQTRIMEMCLLLHLINSLSINHDTASCRNKAEAPCEASQSASSSSALEQMKY
ncbi:hypothetical protein NA56DRAFT_703085 [Hyaloscypha hepaticicola]|uniref:Uncharacterized protein n=1 Tax=Hyaloscypha hepaticicola TaxID=2082293 RepID=A0A2J6Q743_9HELO|nr:hypothetical protein NA56DRAFT_703085 [Hyaloscypha hepaticicola]